MPRSKVIFSRRETIIVRVTMVRGPATVRVDGACRLLGMDVSDRTVQVRLGKAMPFELGTGCTLELEGGESWEADPSGAGTAMWAGLVEQILDMSDRRLGVMLVGATDTGKSTLATYIANTAIVRGILPCVVDGDMGQGDLAPPTAIGAAVVREQVADLRDVAARYYEFVGSVSPAGSERLVVNAMKSIYARTKKLSRLHIINTDGYVADGGAAYKRMLARALAPNVVVCVGRPVPTLGRGRWLFLQAQSSRQAVKTRSDRVGRRMDQFMRHVGEGTTRAQTCGIKYVYSARPIPISRVLRLFRPSVNSIFVGLALDGIMTGFGIIESLGEEILIRTSVGNFDTVYLSNVALRGGVERRLRG